MASNHGLTFCDSCGKNKNTVGMCNSCKGELCELCYEAHSTGQSFKGHTPNLFGKDISKSTKATKDIENPKQLKNDSKEQDNFESKLKTLENALDGLEILIDSNKNKCLEDGTRNLRSINEFRKKVDSSLDILQRKLENDIKARKRKSMKNLNEASQLCIDVRKSIEIHNDHVTTTKGSSFIEKAKAAIDKAKQKACVTELTFVHEKSLISKLTTFGELVEKVDGSDEFHDDQEVSELV